MYRVSHDRDKIKSLRFLLFLTKQPNNTMTTRAEKWRFIREKLRSGEDIRTVAEHVGVHWSTIYRYRRMIEAPKKRSRKQPVVTSRLRSRIKKLAHGVVNMSSRKIVTTLKEKGVTVSQSTVSRVLKSLGLVKKKTRNRSV